MCVYTHTELKFCQYPLCNVIIHLPLTSIKNNYVRSVVFKLAEGKVSLQVPWFSPTSIIPIMLNTHSLIRLSLMLYNRSSWQLHYLLNTKINVIIINGSYFKNEFDSWVCMKVRAYWRKWQNEWLQSHFRVIRYEASGSSDTGEKCIHGFGSGTWRKGIS